MTKELIRKAFDENPPKLESVWPGFPLGTVGVLTGPTGVGKSFWALEAAIAVASGSPEHDLIGIRPEAAGRVVYFASPEPESLLVQRIRAIGRILGQKTEEALIKNLFVYPYARYLPDLANGRSHRYMADLCTDARLVVLDRLDYMHTFDLNRENDVRRLASMLWYIAANTGASVLVLRSGRHWLEETAYWIGELRRMTVSEYKHLLPDKSTDGIQDQIQASNFVCLNIEKHFRNAPSKTHIGHWYRRHEGGVLISHSFSE